MIRKEITKNINQESTYSIPLVLNEKNGILTDTNKNIVIDAKDVFTSERNESKSYRIFGKIRTIFKNIYYGFSNYSYLNKKLYLVSDGSDGNFLGYLPYNEFAFIRKDHIRVKYDETVVTDYSQFTGQTYQILGQNDHMNILENEAHLHNWVLYLSYVYSHDEDFNIKYTTKNNNIFQFKSGDGVLFEVEDIGNFIKLKSPYKHNMSFGEYIDISGTTFNINNVGDEFHDSENFSIYINKAEIPSDFTYFENEIVFGKRKLSSDDDSVSKYYVRKHKILTDHNDYTLNPLSFESSIWKDERKILFENSAGENDIKVERNKSEVLFYNFKEPFILTGITDNQGITPREVFLTTVFRNGNGYFDYPVKVGFGFNIHDTWVDEQFNGNDSIESTLTYTTFYRTEGEETFEFNAGNFLNVGDILIGDFVEYNEKELKEIILSHAHHKIVSNLQSFYHSQNLDSYYSGATNNNKVGLFYKVFNGIKLKQESPYIETSFEKEIDNLPENTKYFENEKMWRWRDLYENGYVDNENNGVDFPFINGSHYVKNDINFYLKNEKTYKKPDDVVISFNDLFERDKDKKIIC